MEYLIFHPEIIIVGVIFIPIILFILYMIYDRVTSTYNGVYYGSKKRSKSEYELVSVEITRIKTVRITIKETFGKRTVSGYSQFKGVKFANLSPWETKIKTYIKSVPLSECSVDHLMNRTDEDLKVLAEDIAANVANAIKSKQNVASAGKCQQKVMNVANNDVTLTECQNNVTGEELTRTIINVKSFSVNKVEPVAKKIVDDKSKFRFEGIEIDQKKAYATVKFYNKVSEEYFNLGVILDDWSLNRLEESIVPINFFAKEIRDKIEEFPDDWKLQRKILNFWRDADKLIEQYSEEKNAEAIYELMINIWQTRDKCESAIELHFCTLNAIKHLYPLRDINDSVVDMTLDLCELDISNFENLKEKMDITACSLITPNKKAIILEKKRLYLEALEFSEWCLARGIREECGKTFEARIERLKKKVNII